jgi:hypothetical protein
MATCFRELQGRSLCSRSLTGGGGAVFFLVRNGVLWNYLARNKQNFCFKFFNLPLILTGRISVNSMCTFISHVHFKHIRQQNVNDRL